MVDPEIFPALAASVIGSVNVRDGDAVFIAGGAHQQAFLEEIGVEVARRGGEPFITAVSDRYMRRMLEAVSVETCLRTPKIGLAAAQAMDVYVVIEPTGDPSYKKGLEDKIKARSEGRQPITDTIYGRPGKRWVYMGWATEGMAKTYGVPLPVLEKLVIGGSLIDYGQLRADCAHVIRMLADAKRVHVTDPHGTDFYVDIEGRTLLADDGMWSPEKEASGDWGANLPAGEVFVAPVETAGEGTVVCPLTVDDLTRSTILRDVRLFFKDGTLVPDRCTAGDGQDILRDNFRKFAEIDMDRHGAANALKIAELGIGLNPAIDRAIGYILTDEKIGGSVHVAFGRSDGYGGKVSSAMHWDFVTAPDITLEAEYTDGRRMQLIKNGRLVK
ncbi:MAG: Thermophilic metalloprotease (M29) [Methanocella sp. PtaU1.Bin125]|nr:MAG: Thermophilic metalloprotease (M29) [Methanocella sp. PtaU1.Bin125]